MRLIDADDLLKQYDREHEGPPGRARELIENAPTVEDVTKVIRCEHCKHGIHSGRGPTYYCIVSPEELGIHKYDFWCAYAERRNDG